MKFLFHLGHPAHFHLFKNTIKELKKKSNKVYILIKKKDVLEDLLIKFGIEYINILPEGRKDNKFNIAIGVLKQDFGVFKHALKIKPDLLIGTSFAISHVGKLLNIPSINVNEDDTDVVPLYAKLAYPYSSCIIAPQVCSVGKWEYKKISYFGYHELAYLHPNHFKPNQEIAEKYVSTKTPYSIIRFAKLGAHHDKGIRGINTELAKKIITILKPFGNIFITSEKKLPSDIEQYRVKINPIDIHHVMAFASIYIGDSQTMAAEAGVLGVPFIRYNDFVGRISYLAELENKYKLGYGIKPNNPDKLLKKIDELISTPNLNQAFNEKRNKMLSEKIDFSKFLTWFIENYPESVRIMKKNPDYQYNFR
jgi:hypothetical protein